MPTKARVPGQHTIAVSIARAREPPAARRQLGTNSLTRVVSDWQDPRAISPACGVAAGVPPMNHAELAWEFADLFAELDVENLNEILAKNVSLETLDFFQQYGESFAAANAITGDSADRLPNLLLMGYLLRVVEERLIDGEDEPLA
jgi:hypothetical protein